jgi:FkbH-like protein
VNETKSVVLQFSIEELNQFAAISHDRNPLHVDQLYARKTPFGQRVVFGALAVLKCLAHTSFAKELNLVKLSVEFHNTIFVATQYAVNFYEDATGTGTIALKDGNRTLLRIAYQRQFTAFNLLAHTPKMVTTTRTDAAEKRIDTLMVGEEFRGVYDLQFNNDSERQNLLPLDLYGGQTEHQLIMLTSYLVGMEIPGRQALFSKLELEFTSALPKDSNVLYNVVLANIDPHLGLLFLDLLVTDTAGNPIAAGKIQAFIRNTLTRASHAEVTRLLHLAKDRPLQGKTALVIGGSRGLGAELVQALALCGADVYLNYATCDDDAHALKESLIELPNQIHLIKGSVDDIDFCKKIKKDILSVQSSLDMVICNACSSPQVMTIDENTSAAMDDYIRNNMHLVTNPLQIFISELQKSGGTFCAISSIYVATGSKDFPQYVALKNVVEGIVKSASLIHKNVKFLLPRPPKLLTDMSNTPIGSIGAIAPEIVATAIVSKLISIPTEKTNHSVMDSFEVASDFDSSQSTSSVASPLQKSTRHQTIPTFIAATFSVDLILPSMNFWTEKLNSPFAFSVTPYNQPFQELLSPQSQFNQNRDGYNVLFLRYEDFLPYEQNNHSTENGTVWNVEDNVHVLKKTFAEFTTALTSYAARNSTPLELFLCPSLEIPDKNLILADVFIQFTQQLRVLVEVNDNIQLTVVEDFHEFYAVSEYRDSLRYKMGHIPYIDTYFHTLGTLATRRLFSYSVAPYKVIVLDCDNTIWKGVCDEAGASGVEVNDGFREFQAQLVDQYDKGVLLCLCSKNREQAVWDVFEQHPGMLLQKTHIVDHCINWENKSENIRALAARLNLGLDSFIFIDDNPVECADVRLRHPEVLTLQMPQNPAQIKSFVNHLWVLDKRSVTQEDKQRTRLYQDDKARKALENQTEDFASFIASLDLHISFEPINDSNIARAAQLTKRTNQFNLSTRRRGESEIMELVRSGYHGLAISVTDRFGDYGMVGLVLAKPRKNTFFIDTFLLSCRVLGRGVEHKIVAKVADLASSLNLDSVIFHYLKSKKNEPLVKFLNEISRQLELNNSILPDVSDANFEISSSNLSLLEFNPIENAADETEQNVENKSKAPAVRADSAGYLQKILEQQVLIYSNIDQLNKQLTAPDRSVGTSTHNEAESNSSHIDVVIEIFSRVLAVEKNKINVDQDLETLVDESYKIVDLTVALKAVYPKIPQTLLFETNSIREIVKIITGERTGIDSVPAPHKVSADDHREDIAIIGMNGVFPGAANIIEFWDNLKAGICSIDKIPGDRWEIDEFYEEGSTSAQKSYCNVGGFIKDAFNFDNQFFGISPREAETMDPQQRLFLQTVWGLMEDAGYTRTTLPKSTGVFLGVISSDYALNAYQATLNGFSHYRMSDFYQIPNRVSYYFDLHGPSLAIDSACSSSASALHLACASLRSGECETVIVGGVNLITHPSRLIQYAQMQMISKSGVCSPFSDAADGTLFGEGVCALLLKPLSKAIADGDNIHGIVKSSSVNSGGKTNGFTVPNPTAHAELIRNALVEKNISPRSIGYIEAHGTATNLGDPIEIRGLTEGFYAAEKSLDPHVSDDPSRWCSLGSVKSNIGHLESCAALAGIIKCLLQMKYQTLVPSLTRGTLTTENAQPLLPNSKIAFEETPFKLQYHASEWLSPDQPRRAGISSFGAGGANAHVIIEEAPAVESPVGEENSGQDFAVILSAPSEQQLQSLVTRLQNYFVRSPNINLKDICYTLQTGREHFAVRLALVCQSVDELHSRLESWQKGISTGNLWFNNSALHNSPNTLDDKETLAVTRAADKMTEWAQHWTQGHALPWQKLYVTPGRKISLPGIEFAGSDYRIPQKYLPKTTAVEDAQVAESNFIGTPIISPFINDTIFESRFDMGNLPYLTDHRIYDAVVVPGSMYLAYVLTLASKLWPSAVSHIQNVTFIRALLPNQHQSIQFSAKPADEKGASQVAIVSYNESDSSWVEHFNCAYNMQSRLLEPDVAAVNIEAIRASMTNSMDTADFYRESVEIGFRWGPDFQCVRELHRRDGEALGRVTLTDSLLEHSDHYAIHPAFLDACFQVFVPGMSSSGLQKETRQAYLPLGVNEIYFYRPVPNTVWSHVITKDDLKKDSLTIDIFLYAEDGTKVAYFKEMQVLRTSKSALMALAAKPLKAEAEYGIHWIPLEIPVNQTSPLNSQIVCGGFNHSEVYEACTRLSPAHIKVFDGEENLPQIWLADTPVYLLFNLHPLAPTADCDAEIITANILKNIHGVRNLLSQLDKAPGGTSTKLFLLADGAPLYSDQQDLHYLKNCFAGLGRVIALEYPEYWGGMIEINSLDQSDNKWQSLLHVITFDSEDHYQIGETIKVPRLQKTAIQASHELHLDSDARYLITGAFGSLGQQVSEQLVSNGARNLILVSRSLPDEKAQAFITKLERAGAQIKTLAVNLADYEQLRDAITSVGKDIKGVVHLAGLLEDGALGNLTDEQFQKVLAPKVAGTWNLHRIIGSAPLDFFVLFSSASSLLGAAGQANYALANGFLDAFAHYRQQLGLPATSINWGPWSGSGMAAEQSKSRKTWTNESFGGLTANVALQAFTKALTTRVGNPQWAVLPYNWNELLKHYPVAKISSLLKQLSQHTKRQESLAEPSEQIDFALIALLEPGVPRAERKRLVTDYLRTQVRKILGFAETDSIDGNRSFLNLGFDSLMAVSFRTALSKSLKCYLPATLIFDYPTLNSLAENVLAQLIELDAVNRQLTSGADNPVEAVVSAIPEHTSHVLDIASLEDISSLSQEELEKILEAELDEIERILEV